MSGLAEGCEQGGTRVTVCGPSPSFFEFYTFFSMLALASGVSYLRRRVQT